MRIYLDMCSIQSPLDTKSQPRIAVEAEAVLGVLMLCEAGQGQVGRQGDGKWDVGPKSPLLGS